MIPVLIQSEKFLQLASSNQNNILNWRPELVCCSWSENQSWRAAADPRTRVGVMKVANLVGRFGLQMEYIDVSGKITEKLVSKTIGMILIGVMQWVGMRRGWGGRCRVTSRGSSQPSEVLGGPRRITQAHSCSPGCRLTLIWGPPRKLARAHPHFVLWCFSCIGGHAFRLRAHSASLTCSAIRGQWGCCYPRMSIVVQRGAQYSVNTYYSYIYI